MQNYSQNNEQEIILKWCKEHGLTEREPLHLREGLIGLQKLLINSAFTYLDIGANDGITLSNTYPLALMGCSGYAVEASKKAFDKLKSNYESFPGIQLFNLAITADTEGEITFYESGTHLNKGDVSLLSTTHESELKRWEGSNNSFEKSTAIAVPFENFYKGLYYQSIQFVSLDIEGEDLSVLLKMNLTEMQTHLICLEHNSNQQVKEQMISYCKSHGLSNILLENAENIIICK